MIASHPSNTAHQSAAIATPPQTNLERHSQAPTTSFKPATPPRSAWPTTTYAHPKPPYPSLTLTSTPHRKHLTAHPPPTPRKPTTTQAPPVEIPAETQATTAARLPSNTARRRPTVNKDPTDHLREGPTDSRVMVLRRDTSNSLCTTSSNHLRGTTMMAVDAVEGPPGGFARV